jgi:hypothetical protein
MLSRGVVMIHDNARPHTAAATQNIITTFAWEQSDHPPYSPDLAPSDFRLFLHLKSFLAGHFLGVKLPENEFDYSSPSSAEVKNEWIYASNPTLRLHGGEGEKFIFTFLDFGSCGS